METFHIPVFQSLNTVGGDLDLQAPLPQHHHAVFIQTYMYINEACAC